MALKAQNMSKSVDGKVRIEEQGIKKFKAGFPSLELEPERL